MKKITSKKLLKYGTLSAAALGCSIANSQIIYTDIDDIDVFNDGPFINLDINGDGIGDFGPAGNITAGFILAASFVESTYLGSSFVPNNNALVGFSGSSYNYASNLAEGTIIDSNSPFTNQGEQVILNLNGCANSNSQFCGGVVDGYVGISFEIGTATHYGWIRVDIAADGSGFTIKDFAYGANPDTAIEAGDGVLSLEDNIINGFSSFVDTNNVLQLNAGSPLSAISVYNITGQQVMSKELSNTAESIDVNALSSGVYIARVVVEGIETAIKFVKK